MSFSRFAYYCAVGGGWAGLLAGLIVHALMVRGTWLPSTMRTVLAAAILGAMIAVGLRLVAGLSSGGWSRHLGRFMPGLVGGAVGGGLGTLVYTYLGLPQSLGWMLMGAAIGAADGLADHARRKTRNGLIGGTLGGLVGGLLFNPLTSGASELSGRVVGFVTLGLSTGLLVGLAQVVLKEAWLTVLDGFRPGRQLVLNQAVTLLGRGDHLPMPFLGYSGKDLESEHLRIRRQADGAYVLEDNHTRIGVLLNGQPVREPIRLCDGDLVKLGTNIVRFNERRPTSDRSRPPITASLPPVFSPGPSVVESRLPQPSLRPPPPPPPSSQSAPPARPESTPAVRPGPRIPPPPPPPPR